MIKKLILLPMLLVSESLWANGNTGGMDGGGGGVLPAHPAPIQKIREFAEEAKPQLLFLLNGYEKSYGSLSNTLIKKLFGGPQKAQEVLKGLRLEVREAAPCLTSTGVEVDASIHAFKPNTICLSAQRISQKLDEALLEREVLALLMHEVAHFMGADEIEAVKFQKDIAERIMNSSSEAKIDTAYMISSMANFINDLGQGLQKLEKGDLTAAEKTLLDACASLNRVETEGEVTALPYQFWGPRESQYQYLLSLKLVMGITYLQTLVADVGQDWARERYDEPFKGRNYFYLGEEANDGTHLYAMEKITKLNSVSELIELLKGLRAEYLIRGAYTSQASYGMNWLNLNGHLTVPASNPWEKFIGTYVVQSVLCEGRDDVGGLFPGEFRVEKTPTGLNWVAKSKGSMSSDPIQVGAYNVNSYLNSYGESPTGEVFMVYEMGGSWSSRDLANMSVSEIRLKTNLDRTFEITHSRRVLPKDVTKAEFNQTCVYKGTVQ